MKCAIAAALLCLLCLGHVDGQALKVFTPGNEYQYTYLAQALSGLPDISAQKAGLALKGTVLIQATQAGSLKVKIEQLQMATINEVLRTVDLENIPYQWQSIGGDEEFIKSPMKVNMQRGAITDFETSGDEPEKVTNIKKAILTTIQLQLKAFPSPHSSSSQSRSAYSSGKYASLVAYKSQIDEQVRSDNNNLFAVYSVMEDDVAGKCESRYIVSSQPWKGNPNAQVANATKIDDYENCEDDDGPRDWLMSNMAPNNCTECEADERDMVNTVKVTEYDVRVQQGHLIIERIESVAETVFTPLSANSDEQHINHTQILILRDMRPITNPMPSPVNPERHEELEYTFPGVNGTQPTEDDLVNRPLQFAPLDGQRYPQEVRRLVKEITREIHNNPRSPMEGTPFKAAQCSRAWRTLPKSDVSQLYNELIAPGQDSSASEEAHIQRRVALDTLLMSGSLPGHSLLMSKIAKQEIDGEEANQVLTSIAIHTRRPIVPIIDKLQKLCESEVINRNKQAKSTCWLTFASLVEQSCSDDGSDLPVTPDLDTYCTDSQAKQFVQVLGNQLNNANRKQDRLLFVYALSIISREEVVQVLRPYANGKRRVSEAVRVMAIDVISDIESDEVLDILEPILYNTEEESHPRIAALRGIITNSPDDNVFEKLALLTDDDDDQLASFVLSTLEQYANTSHPCLSEKSAHTTQALSFAEDDRSYGIQDSQVVVVDDYDEDTDSGAILRWAYVSNNDSLIPRSAALSLKRTISGYEAEPLSIMANLEGIQSVIDRTIGPKATFANLDIRQILRKSYSNESPKNYHNQFKKLNIDPREDEPLFVTVKVQTQNDGHRMIHIDADTISQTLQNALSSSAVSKLMSGEGVKVNYQKLTAAGTIMYQCVSCLGLPIGVFFQSPIIMDVKGKVAVQINHGSSASLMPQEISLQTELSPTVSINIKSTMGIMDPFKKVFVGAGVASKTFLTLPFKMTAKVDLQEARLTTKVIPLAPLAGSSSAKIFSYKVKPYTIVYPYDKFESIASTAKPIMDNDKPDEYKFNIGNELTGIPLQLDVKSCMFWQDQGSFLQYIFEDNSLLSHAMLWWATPDFKHREYQLTADANAASSTEITTVVDLDYLPSKFQQVLRQGQQDMKGSLAFFLGWTALPWQCEKKSHDESTLPNYPGSSGSEQGSSGTVGYGWRWNSNDGRSSGDDNHQASGSQQSKRQSLSEKYWHSDLDPSSEHTRSSWSSGDQQSSTQTWSSSSGVKKVTLTGQDADNAIRVKVDVAVKGQVSRAVHSVTTLTRNKLRMTDKIEAKIDIRNPPYTQSDRLQICASSNVAYPTLPCDVANSLNPESVKPVRAHVSVTYGDQCSPDSSSNSANHITVDAQFSKDKEQKENEAAGNQWYLRQCVEDYRAGRRISAACMTACNSMANLNKEVIDTKYNNVPNWLVNATSKAENFFKYYLFSHMSNNPIDVNNGEGRIKLAVTFDSQSPTVDIHVFKPKANTFFEDVYTGDFSWLPPVNARQSFVKMFMKDLMNGDAPPTCKLMTNEIESFENMTYGAPLTNCKHVLTKDCSPSNLFGVLASETGDGSTRELEVQLLERRIVAKPIGAAHQGQFEVTIDGDLHLRPSPNEPIVMRATSPEGHGKVLAFIVLVGELLHIRAPHHMMWVKFDGQNVKIELSNAWRGEVCGMCGEMTGNSDDPFIGPAQCSYADEQDFALAYAVPSSQCSAPSPSNKKTCPDDDNDNQQQQQQNDNDNDNEDNDDDDTNGQSSASRSWSSKNFDQDSVQSQGWSSSSSSSEVDSSSNKGSLRSGWPDDDDDDGLDKSPRSKATDDLDSWSTSSGRSQQLQLNMQYRNGKACFSMYPILSCGPGSYQTQLERKVVRYRCYSIQSTEAKVLKSNPNSGQLAAHAAGNADFVQVSSVPVGCQKV